MHWLLILLLIFSHTIFLIFFLYHFLFSRILSFFCTLGQILYDSCISMLYVLNFYVWHDKILLWFCAAGELYLFYQRRIFLFTTISFPEPRTYREFFPYKNKYFFKSSKTYYFTWSAISFALLELKPTSAATSKISFIPGFLPLPCTVVACSPPIELL